MVKNLSDSNAGDVRDMGSIPGSGKSPGEGTATCSNILAWWAIVHRVTKSQTRLK